MFAPKIQKNQPDQSQCRSPEAIAESGTDLGDGSRGNAAPPLRVEPRRESGLKLARISVLIYRGVTAQLDSRVRRREWLLRIPAVRQTADLLLHQFVEFIKLFNQFVLNQVDLLRSLRGVDGKAQRLELVDGLQYPSQFGISGRVTWSRVAVGVVRPPRVLSISHSVSPVFVTISVHPIRWTGTVRTPELSKFYGRIRSFFQQFATTFDHRSDSIITILGLRQLVGRAHRLEPASKPSQSYLHH
jgi:hypothetical protein